MKFKIHSLFSSLLFQWIINEIWFIVLCFGGILTVKPLWGWMNLLYTPLIGLPMGLFIMWEEVKKKYKFNTEVIHTEIIKDNNAENQIGPYQFEGIQGAIFFNRYVNKNDILKFFEFPNTDKPSILSGGYFLGSFIIITLLASAFVLIPGIFIVRFINWLLKLFGIYLHIPGF